MVNYEEDTVKLTNMKLSKPQSEELPLELLLTTRQKTKIRSSFANIISTDVKHSKAEISKTIQSGGFLGALFVN